MNFKNFFLIMIFALAFIAPAQSRVVADVSSVHTEGDTFRARGVKLTSKTNPAKAWVENLDGTNKSNLPITVNNKETAIQVTMPLVESDTKMYLYISGGDVSESDPQKYFIIVINNPGLDTSTFENLPTVTGSTGSNVGGTGPQGPQGPAGLPGYIYGGDRDIDTLPDYDEGYDSYDALKKIKAVVRESSINQTAGEINIGSANAVTIVDSNTATEEVLGLIAGTGSVGQKVTFIVDNFFFLALSDPRYLRASSPVVGSIVAPDFFSVKRPLFDAPTRTIEVSRYQLIPIFPGMVLEFVFDGTQWRLMNLPTYYLSGPCGPFSLCD
jgi:hypothetical protein